MKSPLCGLFFSMKNLFGSLLILLMPLTLSSQTYIGIVTSGEVIMDLKLIMSIKNDSIYGETIMNSGTSIESRSKINGFVSDNGNMYFVKEINVINQNSFSDSTSFCLLEMNLNKNNNKLSGTFVGNYSDGELCSRGLVELSRPKFLEKNIQKVKTKIDSLYKTSAITLTKNSYKSLNINNNKIKVKIWDAGVEDEDMISIFLNKKLILENYKIKKKKKNISFKLLKGENKIVIKARNEGVYPPNTAMFELTDGENKYLFKYSLLNEEKIVLNLIVR